MSNQFTPLTLKELIACQFSSWYPTFRNLNKQHFKEVGSITTKTSPRKNNADSAESKSNPNLHKYNNVTIRSVIIKPLPKEFIEYLESDGITLPLGAENLSSFLPDINHNDDGDWSSDDEAGKVDDDDDDNDRQGRRTGNEKPERIEQHQNHKQYHFPELNEKIKNALDTLGPSIPKLNWSSPKDVTWLNAETLQCSTVGDVYLLLKSSDFCMFDITHALDGVQMDDDESTDDNQGLSIEYELVLRKWSNLHASMEFRCFVSNRNLGETHFERKRADSSKIQLYF